MTSPDYAFTAKAGAPFPKGPDEPMASARVFSRRAKRAAGRPKDRLVLPELDGLLDAAADSDPAAG